MTETRSSPIAAASHIYRKKIDISTVLAGQKLGIKEVDRACPGLDQGAFARQLHAL
jgi:hypothetical protein